MVFVHLFCLLSLFSFSCAVAEAVTSCDTYDYLSFNWQWSRRMSWIIFDNNPSAINVCWMQISGPIFHLLHKHNKSRISLQGQPTLQVRSAFGGPHNVIILKDEKWIIKRFKPTEKECSPEGPAISSIHLNCKFFSFFSLGKYFSTQHTIGWNPKLNSERKVLFPRMVLGHSKWNFDEKLHVWTALIFV